jgi:cyclopropane fatty-acyl-phospholipid synthase-like methyltransferase
MQPTPLNKFDHDAHARSKKETDFWGQIRRTINGKPVDEEQISMIASCIQDKLELSSTDSLLDLACGNGALSSRLFELLDSYQGVDFSPHLIGIANKYFSSVPKFVFVNKDASNFVDVEDNPQRFTKVLCYGSFSYFRPEQAANVLKKIHAEFINVSRVFVGNLPDKNLAEKFYGLGKVNAAELLDNESPIGIWRNQAEFIALAEEHGWKVEISTMPSHYYAAHYRYDALLTREAR